MKKLANITAAVLLSSLVLGGCGDDSDSDASGTAGDAASETSESPSEDSSDDSSGDASEDSGDSDDLKDTDFGEPATGATVKGDGYSYTIPKEWQEITKEAKKIQPSVDSAAGEATQTQDDTFRDNVNVGFNKAPGATLEQLEASVPQQLKGLAPKVKTLDHVVIDGQEAIHHRGVASLKSTKYFLEQFATVDDDGKVMIITFSFSPDVKPAERDKLINGVLAGWKFD